MLHFFSIIFPQPGLKSILLPRVKYTPERILITFFSDQFNYLSRQHLKITFNPELTITELPRDISQNDLLTVMNRDNFDYFFNYHPEEVLATAGDTMLSLRTKDQDYFLTEELQLRLRQLMQNYYFYQQWRQQSSQLINEDSQSQRYFNKNKAVILPLYNAFGEYTA